MMIIFFFIFTSSIFHISTCESAQFIDISKIFLPNEPTIINLPLSSVIYWKIKNLYEIPNFFFTIEEQQQSEPNDWVHIYHEEVKIESIGLYHVDVKGKEGNEYRIHVYSEMDKEIKINGQLIIKEMRGSDGDGNGEEVFLEYEEKYEIDGMDEWKVMFFKNVQYYKIEVKIEEMKGSEIKIYKNSEMIEEMKEVERGSEYQYADKYEMFKDDLFYIMNYNPFNETMKAELKVVVSIRTEQKVMVDEGLKHVHAFISPGDSLDLELILGTQMVYFVFVPNVDVFITYRNVIIEEKLSTIEMAVYQRGNFKTLDKYRENVFKIKNPSHEMIFHVTGFIYVSKEKVGSIKVPFDFSQELSPMIPYPNPNPNDLLDTEWNLYLLDDIKTVSWELNCSEEVHLTVLKYISQTEMKKLYDSPNTPKDEIKMITLNEQPDFLQISNTHQMNIMIGGKVTSDIEIVFPKAGWKVIITGILWVTIIVIFVCFVVILIFAYIARRREDKSYRYSIVDDEKVGETSIDDDDFL